MSQIVEDATKKYEERFKDLYNLHFANPLDEDGYPTAGALELIEAWHYNDPRGWFNFIETIWHLRSWGWHHEEAESESIIEKKVIRYDISTAGWSGNESIIRAMEKNWMLWNDTWLSSRRGGHYVFEIDI